MTCTTTYYHCPHIWGKDYHMTTYITQMLSAALSSAPGQINGSADQAAEPGHKDKIAQGSASWIIIQTPSKVFSSRELRVSKINLAVCSRETAPHSLFCACCLLSTV